MIGKDKLGFDVTDADTIEASDSVGAFLRSSDGTLITHTTIGSVEALDVNVANTITTSSSSNFAEDSAHVSGNDGTHILAVRNDTEGSLVSADGDYASLQVDSVGRLRVLQRALTDSSDSVAAVQSGTWNVNISDNGGSITVDAADLDIRDLAFATDSVTAHQGGTWTIDAITNDVSINDGGNSITVDAADLDIRDLSHTSDSVRIGDGTNFLAYVGATGIARFADFHTAAANSAVSIDNTAGGTDLVASALSNRTNMFVQNLGKKPVFLGVGTVTAANGLRLAPNSTLEARIGAALSLKAIAQDSAAQDVRILELA